jgi:hypothetical protein
VVVHDLGIFRARLGPLEAHPPITDHVIRGKEDRQSPRGSGGDLVRAERPRVADGKHVRGRLRDNLFAALEDRFPDAVFEVRGHWPAGPVGWSEVIRLGLR